MNRIVETARALVADPHNMEARKAYMRATFNHDRTAAAIVSLADDGSQTSVQSDGEASNSAEGDGGRPNSLVNADRGKITPGDIAWLEGAKDAGHCGEGTLERTGRQDHNERIDRILSALSLGASGDSSFRAEHQPSTPGGGLEQSSEDGIPAGWRLVPEEPTEAMVAAGARWNDDPPIARGTWGRMLAAAPPPPTEVDTSREGPCRHCGDGDPVPASGYWRCPVCDAEWNVDDPDTSREDGQ